MERATVPDVLLKSSIFPERLNLFTVSDHSFTLLLKMVLSGKAGNRTPGPF